MKKYRFPSLERNNTLLYIIVFYIVSFLVSIGLLYNFYLVDFFTGLVLFISLFFMLGGDIKYLWNKNGNQKK